MMGLSPAFLMACRKAGLQPGRAVRPLARPRSSASPDRRCRRRAMTGSTSSSAPTCCSTTAAAAPTSAPGSSGRRRCSPSTGARSPGRCLGVDAEAFDADGQQVVGELGRARDHAGRCRRCRSGFWNDPGGERYRGGVLRHVPGRVAPGRLGAVHRARQLRRSPGARTRRSTAAACAWARASYTRSSRSFRRSRTASSCTWRTATAARAS